MLPSRYLHVVILIDFLLCQSYLNTPPLIKSFCRGRFTTAKANRSVQKCRSGIEKRELNPFRSYSPTSILFNSESNAAERKNIPRKQPVDDDSNDTFNDQADQIYRATTKWLEMFIIGMDVCPFAAKPYRQKGLNIQVLLTQDEEFILKVVLDEMRRLAEIDERQVETTLLVTPNLYADDFMSYLNFVLLIEAEGKDLEGWVQLVAFHPFYQFRGSSLDDVDNYTNRSPYPIIHILRECDVSRAVETMPDQDASVVWQRNVDLLKAIEKEVILTHSMANMSTSIALKDLLVYGKGAIENRGWIDELLKQFKRKSYW